MMRVSGLLWILACLTACGADGEPTPPTVSGNATVSANSNSGLSTDTTVRIHFGGS